MADIATDVFNGLAAHLNKYADGNSLQGRYLKNINDALMDYPFCFKDNFTIRSAGEALDVLHEKFYDLLPANHPVLPQQGAANVTLSVYLLSLSNPRDSDKLKAKFRLKASWVAGAKHARSPSREGNIPKYNTLSPSEWRRRIFDDNNNEYGLEPFLGPPMHAKAVAEDNQGQEDIHDEEELGNPQFFLTTAEVKQQDGGLVEFTAQATLDEEFISRGNSENFPFDQETIQLHLTSDVPTQQILLCNQGLETVTSHFVRNRYWSVGDVSIHHAFRNEQHQDLPAPTNNEGVVFRSKVIVTITFIRNASYWFWKALVPMDVITIVGMTPLLLIPKAVESDASPTPDQRFLVVTVVVIVLVAQAAFITSVQPILPDVSYVTIMDFHNTFCLMITAVEAFLIAAISEEAWVILSRKFRLYPVFGAAILLLILEHTVFFYRLQRRSKHQHCSKV